MSEVRLTADGRWLHDGVEVRHARIVAAMHRGIERYDAEGPDYVVRVGGQAYPIVVDDTPWIVRSVTVRGEGREERLVATLNTGEVEPLDPATLSVGAGNVLYGQLPDGRRARLSRSAYHALSDRFAPDGDGFGLRLGGRLWTLC